MENKLKMELDALPTPTTTFEELEVMNNQPKTFRLRKRAVVIMAAVLAMLLCGMGWAKMQYGMWYLIGSREWNDMADAAEKYHIVLPETLDGTPFYEYNIYGLVPRGAPYAVALASPAYKPRMVTYATEVIDREYHSSGMVSSETPRQVDKLSLHFGTTENALWRYYFQVDEQGIYTACNVPESYYTIAYKGITLQICDTVWYYESDGRTVYTRWVHWVDEEKQVAFSLNESDYTDPDRVVECAKAIIDLNS